MIFGMENGNSNSLIILRKCCFTYKYYRLIFFLSLSSIVIHVFYGQKLEDLDMGRHHYQYYHEHEQLHESLNRSIIPGKDNHETNTNTYDTTTIPTNMYTNTTTSIESISLEEEGEEETIIDISREMHKKELETYLTQFFSDSKERRNCISNPYESISVNIKDFLHVKDIKEYVITICKELSCEEKEYLNLYENLLDNFYQIKEYNSRQKEKEERRNIGQESVDIINSEKFKDKEKQQEQQEREPNSRVHLILDRTLRLVTNKFQQKVRETSETPKGEDRTSGNSKVNIEENIIPPSTYSFSPNVDKTLSTKYYCDKEKFPIPSMECTELHSLITDVYQMKQWCPNVGSSTIVQEKYLADKRLSNKQFFAPITRPYFYNLLLEAIEEKIPYPPYVEAKKEFDRNLSEKRQSYDNTSMADTINQYMDEPIFQSHLSWSHEIEHYSPLSFTKQIVWSISNIDDENVVDPLTNFRKLEEEVNNSENNSDDVTFQPEYERSRNQRGNERCLYMATIGINIGRYFISFADIMQRLLPSRHFSLYVRLDDDWIKQPLDYPLNIAQVYLGRHHLDLQIFDEDDIPLSDTIQIYFQCGLLLRDLNENVFTSPISSSIVSLNQSSYDNRNRNLSLDQASIAYYSIKPEHLIIRSQLLLENGYLLEYQKLNEYLNQPTLQSMLDLSHTFPLQYSAFILRPNSLLPNENLSEMIQNTVHFKEMKFIRFHDIQGGLNNQLQEIAGIFAIANLLDRVVILPNIISSDFVGNANLLSFGEVFDVAEMRINFAGYIKMVTVEEYTALQRNIDAIDDKNLLSLSTSNIFEGNNDKSNSILEFKVSMIHDLHWFKKYFTNRSNQVISFSGNYGAFTAHHGPLIWKFFRQNMKFSRYVTAFADNIVNVLSNHQYTEYKYRSTQSLQKQENKGVGEESLPLTDEEMDNSSDKDQTTSYNHHNTKILREIYSSIGRYYNRFFNKQYIAVHMRIEQDWENYCGRRSKHTGNLVNFCNNMKTIVAQVVNHPLLQEFDTIYVAMGDNVDHDEVRKEWAKYNKKIITKWDIEESYSSMMNEDIYSDTFYMENLQSNFYPNLRESLPYTLSSAIDLLVCSKASAFVGTSLSTFSQTVGQIFHDKGKALSFIYNIPFEHVQLRTDGGRLMDPLDAISPVWNSNLLPSNIKYDE